MKDTQNNHSAGILRKARHILFNKLFWRESRDVPLFFLAAAVAGCLFTSPAFAANYTPQPGTITPSSGTINQETAQTFTTTYSDANGCLNILNAGLLINTAVSAKSCLLAYYNQPTNKLYIYNDAGTATLGGIAPRTADTVIENSYAKIDCSKTKVTRSGTTMTISWNVTFKSPFYGTKNTYLWVKDKTALQNGWTKKGTITINSAPQVGTVTPSSGSTPVNTPVTLSTTATDLDGYQNIRYVYFVVRQSTTATAYFYAYYDEQTKKFYLQKDNSTDWIEQGTGSSIENAYAKLDCSNIPFGSSNTLTINWNITFKNGFTGAKNLYLYAKDKNASGSGWFDKGDITITSNPPAVSEITLTSTGNFHQGWPVTIKAIASDPDGDAIQYRYLVGTTVIQDWTTSSQIDWNPTASNVGLMTFKVETKSQYETGGSLTKQAYIYREPVKVQS